MKYFQMKYILLKGSIEVSEVWEHQFSNTKTAELIRSFRQVQRSINHLMRVQADSLDLTPVQMLVLRILQEKPNLSLNELSDRLELGCSTVSGVVKRLVHAGLIERERLEEDQRTIAVRLTSKGRELERLAFGDVSLVSQALLRFSELPEQKIDMLLDLHQQLIQILNAEGDEIKHE